MAPLNEEDDEDEDSTVFDVKYRYCCEPVRLGLRTELLLVKTAIFSLLEQLGRDEAVTIWLSLCPSIITLQPLCLFSAHIALCSPALAITTSQPLGCLPSSFFCRAAQQDTSAPNS